MPSSLIIGALVLAWLVVLVPMIARRRQEVTRTTESALAARVVRSGSARRGVEEDRVMADQAELEDSEYYPDAHARPARRTDGEDEYVGSDGYYDYAEYSEAGYPDEYLDDEYVEYDDDRDAETDMDSGPEEYQDEEDEQLTDELPIPEEQQPYQRRKQPPRPYRPGRGGFNPEAAEVAKQAKYAFRRRVVLAMVILAVVTLIGAATALPMLWWGHGAVDLALGGYLVYLRRQVRIEEEVRQRRLARIRGARDAERRHAERQHMEQEPVGPEPTGYRPSPRPRSAPPPPAPAGTAVVDVDDDDPAFDELDEPDVLPYRRAAGE